MTEPTPVVEKPGGRHVAALLLLLATLFLERFAYYGMRGTLMMHLTRDLGVPHEAARTVYSFFTTAMYLGAILGAGFAIVVPRKVLVPAGLAFCAVGLALVGSSATALVYGGLGLLVVGLAFYKGALFSLVGELLPGASDALRAAAFTVLYGAVNLGAFASNFASFALVDRAGPWRTMLLLAAMAGLALVAATTAAVVAPPRVGPAPPFRPLPLAGALVLVALALPATTLLEVCNARQFELVREGLEGHRLSWFFSINPLTVAGLAVPLAGGLFALHAARVGLRAAHLVAVGSALYALSALPLVGAAGEGGLLSPAGAATASALLGAVAELPLFVALLSRCASAGQPHFGALAVSLQSGVMMLGNLVASSEAVTAHRGPVLAVLVVLSGAAAVALFLLAGPLQRAFFRDEPGPAPATASPSA